MKKLIMLVTAALLLGCAPVTVEQSIKKLTYQKDPLSGAEYWVIWRTPTFQFRDELLEKYEINSYMKCVKSGDNNSIAMTTHSGAEPIIQKYEIIKDGAEPLSLDIGKHDSRKATLYRGEDAHLDIYEKEFSPEEVKILVEIASTPGVKIRPISEGGDKFVLKKLSDTERTQIQAILTVCKFM